MGKNYTKKFSSGKWLKKGKDFLSGELLELLNQGVEVPSSFGGTQDAFLARTAKGEEGNIGLNQTSINNLIDAYGEDAENWVGKKVKAWLFPDFKDGKPTLKLIVSHPEATITDKGFSLPEGVGVKADKPAKKTMKKVVPKEEIPVIEEDNDISDEDDEEGIDVSKIPFN